MSQFQKIAVISALLWQSIATHATEINGAGSSAAKPLYTKWAEVYGQTAPTTLAYQPIGSSGGIKQIKAKKVDFGASDVALSLEELKKENLINFPSAISGVVPIINIPGVKAGELQLTGDILVEIFSRRITLWNDPAITALNPDLALPKTPIIVVVRQDGSGTTYNFTDYLSKISHKWKNTFGRNFTVLWPGDTQQVKGSSALAAMVKQTPGAIGYVDYNYVVQDRLIYPQLKNRDGKFVAPSAKTFDAALSNSTWKSQGAFEEMLTDRPGSQSWPITMGTFIILNRIAAQPENTIATLRFFTWAFIKGDHVVAGSDFVRLPDQVQGRIFKDLLQITDTDGKPLKWSPL